MQTAINNAQAAKIKKMMKMKVSVEDMSRSLLVTEECIERNIKHFSRTAKEVEDAKKKREAAVKKAQAQALKRQTQEMAEAAAAAEAEAATE